MPPYKVPGAPDQSSDADYNQQRQQLLKTSRVTLQNLAQSLNNTDWRKVKTRPGTLNSVEIGLRETSNNLIQLSDISHDSSGGIETALEAVQDARESLTAASLLAKETTEPGLSQGVHHIRQCWSSIRRALKELPLR